MFAPLDFVVNHAKPGAKVSVILLDWNVRESFHSLQYLNRQTVDRSRYELIWIEFYDRKPQQLLDAVRAAEELGQPLVDKLVVMNYPRDFIFHKHRMYNLGIVLSEGEICVICDSDAMFTPTFVEKIIAAFEREPQSVVHLDEVRSVSRKFYPFNFPTFEEFLASECPNWTGLTTRGLDHSRDMLHDANYGACLAARRADIIRIGGADEHLDYLGYICGPYDLTFRLVNAGCRERWLAGEYLYHTWHPGESGINNDYQGPSDGRGMASRSLAARLAGVVEPGLENGALRALRINPRMDRHAALALLESPADAEWRSAARLSPSDLAPQLIKKAYRGKIDVYFFRKSWYGIPAGDKVFDPARANSGLYVRGRSCEEVERSVLWHFRQFRRACQLLGALYRRPRKMTRALLKVAGIGFDRPIDPLSNSPQIARENYLGHNIIYFRGTFLGVDQSAGPINPAYATTEPDGPYVCGRSISDVKERLCRRMNTTRSRAEGWRQLLLLPRLARSVRRCLPSSVLRAIGSQAQERKPLEPDAGLASICSSE